MHKNNRTTLTCLVLKCTCGAVTRSTPYVLTLRGEFGHFLLLIDLNQIPTLPSNIITPPSNTILTPVISDMSEMRARRPVETSQKHSKVVSASTGTVEFAKGDTVYHKNPVGLNYVFKNRQGTITGFVSATKKRAIVKWPKGPLKKHNVSSLVSSPPEDAQKAGKKRSTSLADPGPKPKKAKVEHKSLPIEQSYLHKVEHRFQKPVLQNSLRSDYIDNENTPSSSVANLIDIKGGWLTELSADDDSDDSDDYDDSDSEWVDNLLREMNSAVPSV